MSLGVLQHCADDLRDACKGKVLYLLTVEEYIAAQVSFIAAWDETIDAADKRRLATSAGTCDEEQFAGFKCERNVLECRLGTRTIAEGEIFYHQWESGIQSVISK